MDKFTEAKLEDAIISLLEAEGATIHDAFIQLTVRYKRDIPVKGSGL